MEKIAAGALSKVLKYGLPAVGGLAGGALLGTQLPKIGTPEQTPTFDEEEKRLFARHGIDPKALSFYKTLGNLMRGMKMQNQFMEMAMQGRPMMGGGEAPDPTQRLSQYA